MKKYKVALLPLLALSLVASCATGNNNNVSSNQPASSQNSGKTLVGDSVESIASSGKQSTSTGGEESNSSDLVVEGEWPAAVKQLMIDNLGGQVLPYLDIGARSNSGSWTEATDTGLVSVAAHLDVAGTKAWSDSMIAAFQATYSSYTINAGSSSATATDSSKGLKVVFKNNDGFPLLTAYYTEPYDPSKAAGDWTSATKAAFASNAGGHSIPYFYIAKAETVSIVNGSIVSIVLAGAMWNDAVLPAATNAFAADTGWSATSGNSSMTYAKTFSDGYKLTVTVASSNGNIQVKIDVVAPYTVPTGADWTDEAKATMTSHFGYVLPYVYLGTLAPTVYEGNWASSYELDFRAGASVTWDYRILTLAYSALDATWTKTYDYESDGSTPKKLTATGSHGNDTLKLVISYSSSYGPQMVATITEAFDASAATSYQTPTTTAFANRLGGFSVPYVYLGTRYETVQSQSDGFVTLSGGKWNANVIANATTVFSALSGWTVTSTTTTFTATYETDAVSASFAIRSSSSKIYADVSVFSVPASGAWQSATSALFSNLGGYALPYVYLGTANESASWTAASSRLTITGGRWNDKILALANTAFSADSALSASWVIDSDADSSTFAARKVTSDGATVLLVEIKAVSNVARLTVDYLGVPAGSAWASDATAAFASALQGYSVPYLYLNSSAPSVASTSKSVTLTGGLFSSALAYSAQQVLANETENGTYTASLTTNTAGEVTGLSASKIFTAGTLVNAKIEITLAKGAYNSTLGGNAAVLTIKYHEPFDASSASDFPASLKTSIETYLGSTTDLTKDVPFVYLGTANPTGATSGSKFVITGGDYDSRILTLAQTAFSADSGVHDVNAEDDRVRAIKGFSDGTSALLDVKQSGDSAVYEITYYPAVTASATGWSSSANSLISSKFHSYALPYIDLGSVSPATNSNAGTVGKVTKGTLTGGAYSYLRMKAAIATLQADTVNGYSWRIDDWTYDDNGPTFSATKVDGSWEYHLIYSVNAAGNAVLTLYAPAAWVPPTGANAVWSSSIQADLDALFGANSGNYLPYFYTNTLNVTRTYSSSTEIDFKGGDWDGRIVDEVIKALSADNTARASSIASNSKKAWGWAWDPSTYSSNASRGELYASRLSQDGTKWIYFKMWANYDGKCVWWLYYR